MSARGRGSVTVKRGVPNLALAGIREASNGNSDPRSSRGTPRGGRGRGRGAGGGRGRGGRGGKDNRPALIESAGIFSEGLSGADPSRRTKEKDESSISFASNSRDRKKTVSPDQEAMLRESGKASFKGWEEMWESDEELDNAELAESMDDTFISDYKRGNRLPIVLPSQDQDDFKKLMHKSAKDELLSDDDAAPKLEGNDYYDEKPKTMCGVLPMFCRQHVKPGSEYAAEFKNPTEEFSRQAGNVFKNLNADTVADTLFLLQLPSVINVMTTLDRNAPNGDGDSKPVLGPDGVILNDDDIEQPVVPRLPRGRSIGKLQVMKSGRVMLNVGGVAMDVSKSIPGGQQESVVLLETAHRPEPTVGILSGRMGDREGRNAIYHLGPVKHHLTASLPWSDVKPMSKEQAKADAARAVLSPSRAVRPTDVSKLQDTLKAMEKERASWAAAAERWAE